MVLTLFPSYKVYSNQQQKNVYLALSSACVLH